MKSKRRIAPKLPRFVVPKNMSSKIFIDKKRRSMMRQALKKVS